MDDKTRADKISDGPDRGIAAGTDAGHRAGRSARASSRCRAASTLSPLNKRRWQNFKANRRGYWSLWIFLVLFFVSLFAEFIANDKPLFVSFDGKIYFPVFFTYPETDVRRRLRNRGRLSRSLPAEIDRRQGRHR